MDADFILMLIPTLLVAVIFIVAGYYLEKHPPQKANGIIGFRTAASRASPESWMLAQRVGGRMMFLIGAACVAIAFLLMIIFQLILGNPFIGCIVTIAVEIAVLCAGMVKVNNIVKEFNKSSSRVNFE